MRNKLIVGNWKMFKNPSNSLQDFKKFTSNISEIAANSKIEINTGIAAPAIYLQSLSTIQTNNVKLYAQNCHWADEGAFTGEISVSMLKELNVRGSLVGHSERRQFFGETNESAGKRLGALINKGMECIFCIGETLTERENGKLKTVIFDQLNIAFKSANISPGTDLIGSNPNSPLLTIAYEPVWAIGTGKSASAVEAQEAHAYVRQVMAELLSDRLAGLIKIQYGGSVNLQNIASYFSCPDIDGALVGGASLKPDDFSKLCNLNHIN